MRYEVVWEIFNKCSGNQMRDVFFEEVETDDPAAFVAAKFEGYEITCDNGDPYADALTFDIFSEGLFQRVSFTAV